MRYSLMTIAAGLLVGAAGLSAGAALGEDGSGVVKFRKVQIKPL